MKKKKGDESQGELLPPEPAPKCEHCGDDGYCEECGVDHDEGASLGALVEAAKGECKHEHIERVGTTEFGKCAECGDDSFPLEPIDPVVEELLAKLASIEKEAGHALHSLQTGSADFKLSECECDQCKAIAPVVAAMHEKAKAKLCSCHFCLVAHDEGNQGHSGSCACKLCKAARMTVQAAQQMRGIIENEW